MDILIEALKALFIGVVEGITEWLPISSTGHMILVDEFVKLNVSEDFRELFLVVIQIAAILAVIILYFTKLNPFSRKKTPEQRKGTWRLWGMVVIGCIPAAIIGVLLDDWTTEHLHNGYCVAATLIIYGIIFIVLEHRNRGIRENIAQSLAVVIPPKAPLEDEEPVRGKHARRNVVAPAQLPVRHEPTDEEIDRAMFDVVDVDEIDWKVALKIGLFQCLAIIPGTSRSGAIIIGGMLMKCSRTAAAEFAFFLAIPIMFGWGLVKALKYIVLGGLVMTMTEIIILIVGCIVAFVVSIISIKFLMGYIKNNDFTAFGIYRIIIGLVVGGYFVAKLLQLF